MIKIDLIKYFNKEKKEKRGNIYSVL